MNEVNPIIQSLKDARRSSGMSQGDVARSVGSTYEHVGRIERGTASPSLDLVCRIADALGIELLLTPKKN